MFVKILLQSELKIFQRLFVRGLSTKPAWDIVTGVCVERMPVVTPPINEMQKKYKDMLYTIEVEKSLKSDHEIRHDNDKIQAELLKNESVDVDLDAVSKITAQDFKDAATEELAQFKFADIETDILGQIVLTDDRKYLLNFIGGVRTSNYRATKADKKGDKTSAERCLQRHLVLVTSLKLGKEEKTMLPQGKWEEGETLRQTAKRVLLQQCGPELKVQFLSNAPCGFYKYKYPSEIDGKVGAKVFFYYANYTSGKVTNKVKANWLTRKELTDILPDRYKKSVYDFLIEESF